MLMMMFKMLTSMRLDLELDPGLELDPVGGAAARQAEIDFAWRLKSIRASTPSGSISAYGTEACGDAMDRL